MMLSIQKLWNIIFFLLCIIGCGYQLIDIGISYFSYTNITSVKYSNPIVIKFPALHACFVMTFFKELIEHIELKEGKDFNKGRNFSDRRLVMNYLTIEDILIYTPNITIKECRYRDDTGYSTVVRNGSYCEEFFNTSKYVFQQYICYKYQDTRNHFYTHKFIQSSFYFERLLYQILFHHNLAHALKIRTTLSSDGMPYVGKNYDIAFYKELEQIKLFQISCDNYTLIKLGYPYDNFFCADNMTEYYDCINNCYEDLSLRMLGKLPFTSFYATPRNTKLITDAMTKDKRIAGMMTKWNEKCIKLCIRYPCIYSYCVTNGRSDSSNYGTSAIRVETSAHPNLIVINMPYIDLSNTLVYTLSTLGTWFGLVIIEYNPLTIIMFIRKKIFHKENIPNSNNRIKNPKRNIITIPNPNYWKRNSITINNKNQDRRNTMARIEYNLHK